MSDYSIEKRYVRKDGSIVWGNLHVGLVLDAHGSPNYFVSTIEDISARRDAEAARDRLLVKEQTTRALLDTFLAAAPVGFALIDRELRYVLVNDALASMNAIPRSEHIGRSTRELLPEIADRAEELIRPVIDSDAPALGVESTAEARVWLGNYYPVHDANGSLLGVGAVIIDITEGKRAEAALRSAGEENARLLDAERVARLSAEQEAQLREQVLAIVSHDLRNPLQSIKGWARALTAAEGDLPAAAERRVEMIRRATDRMEHLIRELLDLASIQGGRLRISPDSIKAVERGVQMRANLALTLTRRLCGSRAPRAGPLEPDRQCDQVHAAGRPHRGARGGRCVGAHDRGE
nr:PAS domain-containing protein [Sandaracinus amylolyticus]